jgi:hypothetical protein
MMAQPVESGPSATEGAGPFDNAAKMVGHAGDGDWGNVALDFGSLGLDLLGTVMDPLGSLAGAGIGWLIEHIEFLHEGLDKLAGDPGAVTAKAQTWDNIAKSLVTSTQQYQASADGIKGSWTSGAGQAYQQTAGSYQKMLEGTASQASGASSAMQAAAALVGTERGLIRDLVSDFVGKLITKGLIALSMSWFTFGGSVAAFIADTVIQATSLASKITSKIGKLVERLGEFAQKFTKVGGKLEAAAKSLEKAGASLAKKAGDFADGLPTNLRGDVTQAHMDNMKARFSGHLPEPVQNAGRTLTEKEALDGQNWSRAGNEALETGRAAAPRWNTADSVAVGKEASGQALGEQPERTEDAANEQDQRQSE